MTDAPPAKRTIAALRVNGPLWMAACRELAADYPHYQIVRGRSDARKPTGVPDMGHIQATAYQLGYEEITTDNYNKVIAAIAVRAERLYPAPTVAGDRIPEPAGEIEMATTDTPEIHLTDTSAIETEPAYEDYADPLPPSTEEASTNFYWTFGREQVFNLQTTIRGCIDSGQIDMHLATIRTALGAVVKLGGQAKSVGRQPDAPPAQPLPGAPIAATPTNGNLMAMPATPPPASTPPAAAQPIGEQSFAAETLVGSILEGKPSWKVKGGRFQQYGVTIWPEALAEARLDVQPGNSYSLAGYTAYYVCKPDGKPQKVVRLVKP